MMIPSAGVIRIRYSKWLPPLSPFPRVSSSCPLSLQDQQVGLTQAFFKLLLLPWFPECVRFGVHPLKVGVSWWLSR